MDNSPCWKRFLRKLCHVLLLILYVIFWLIVFCLGLVFFPIFGGFMLQWHFFKCCVECIGKNFFRRAKLCSCSCLCGGLLLLCFLIMMIAMLPISVPIFIVFVFPCLCYNKRFRRDFFNPRRWWYEIVSCV